MDAIHATNQSRALLVRSDGERLDYEARRQIELWLNTETNDQERDRGLLETALSFDAIALAAVTGVIGNAAWATFPKAASWLRSLRRTSDRIDQQEIIRIIRECITSMVPVSETQVEIREISLTPSGWIAEAYAFGRTYDILTSTDGCIVAAGIRPHE